MPVSEFSPGLFSVMATKNGIIKKSELSAYANPRSNGIRAINLDDDDELISVCITDGKQDLFLMSREGKCIRISEEQFRPLGRVSRGIRGMNIEGTELVGMDVIDPGKSILVVTEKGFGKRTPEESYRCQSRGGKGVWNIRVTERNGEVIGFRQVGDDNGIMLITDKGRLIRMAVSQISKIGRVTQGVKLIDSAEGEKVVDLTVLDETDETKEEGEN